MLLQTSIKPRRDGMVIAIGLDGARLVFSPNEERDLVCFVEHKPTIAHLIGLQDFFPANEADFDLASALAKTSMEEAAGDQEQPNNPDLLALSKKPDDELDLDDDEGNPDAMPMEANTPPQAAPDRAAKRNASLMAAAKPAAKK